MGTTIDKFDMADHLPTQRAIDDYLDAAWKAGDVDGLIEALRVAARAQQKIENCRPLNYPRPASW